MVFACDHRKGINWNLPYVRFGGPESECIIRCKNEICGRTVNADETPKLYWLWKHLDEFGADIIGYCQYRRFFTVAQTRMPLINIAEAQFKQQFAMEPLQQEVLIKQHNVDGILHPAFNVVDCRKTPFTYIWEQMEILEGNKMLPDGMHKAAFDCLLDATPAAFKQLMQQAFAIHENYLCNIFTVKTDMFKLFGSIAFAAIPQVLDTVGDKAKSLHPYWLAYLLERYTSCFYHCMELAGHKFLKVPLMTIDAGKHIEWKQPTQS